MKTKHVVILFGPPGSGKTTVVRALPAKRQLTVIETGNLLEREIQLGTPIGRKIKRDKAAGKLMPTRIVRDVIQVALEKVQGEVILFDGFPRHLAQVEVFFQLLEPRHWKLCSVLALTLDLSIAIQRIAGRRFCPGCGALYNLHTQPPQTARKCDACGRQLRRRPDDRPEVVRRRFATYQRETVPVIEYFQRQHAALCWEESAAQPLEAIARRLSRRLAKCREC